MIPRKELLLTICNRARDAKEAFPDQVVVSECLDKILHYCKDPAFVAKDKEVLNKIRRCCEKARAIVKSDSPDQTAFEDYIGRIMNKVQEKKVGEI